MIALLRRARDVARSEGVAQLLRRGARFAGQRFFLNEEYYLYEHTMREREEAEFLPRLSDFTLRIVRTDDDADKLADATGFDIRRRLVNGRERLSSGAIAFCVLVDRELAHIGWVALSAAAKRALDPRPYRVDFDNGQACTGGSYTWPRYRGKGLMAYGYYERLEFLREIGITTSRNVVSLDNLASQKAHTRLSPRVLARARHLKLLWWESWRETPVP